MDTRDLLKCLNKQNLGNRIVFLGVFCSDQLVHIRNNKKKPFMLISNTLKSHDPPSRMGHWIVIYADSTKVLFLDSFGAPPSIYGEEFVTFMTRINKVNNVVYAFTEGFQSSISLTCGLFSIFSFTIQVTMG